MLLSVEKNVVGLLLIVVPIFTVIVLITISWQTVPKICYLDQNTASELIVQNLVTCSNLCWSKHNSGSDSIVDDCFVIKAISTDKGIEQDLEKVKRDFVDIKFKKIDANKQYQIKVRYDGYERKVLLFSEEVIKKSTTTTLPTEETTTTIPVATTTTTIPSLAVNLVNGMTTEQLVEQMIMSTPDGTKYKNYYLFASNIQAGFSPIPTVINNVQIWPFVATDGEGGLVRRMPKDFNPGRISARDIGSRYTSGTMSILDIENHAKDIAIEMKQHNLNTNLAPVLDVSLSGLIYNQERSFSGNPANVETIGRAFAKGLHDEGVIATGKHFPGYGNQMDNSDFQKATDSRTMQDLENSDIKPYAGLSNDLDMIMMNNIVYTNIDPNNLAVFSPTLTNRARQISPNAVLISDSLTGKNTHLGITFEEMVKRAATNVDILLFSSSSNANAAYSTIVSMINSGEISKELIKEKITRIMVLKEKYSLLKSV